MTITVETKTFKDANEDDFDGKVLHDSVTATDNPCHAVLDGATGDPISPATAGKQDTANTGIAALNTALGAPNDTAASTDTGTFSLIALFKRLLSRTPALGSAAAAASTPVVIASDQVTALASSASLGATNDAAASTDTGTFSLIALTKRALQSLTTIGTNTGRIPAQGTALAAASTPVAIATDQLSTLATATNQSTSNTKLDTVIANTGAGSVLLTASPTVAGATHAANDVVGTKISLTNAARVAAGSGIIQTVTVNVADAVTVPYDVLFFGTDPTNSTFTDDGAFSLEAADQPYLIGTARCTDLIDCGTRKTLQAVNVALPFKLSTGTTLYAVIVARGSAAFTTANGVVLNVAVVQA